MREREREREREKKRLDDRLTSRLPSPLVPDRRARTAAPGSLLHDTHVVAHLAIRPDPHRAGSSIACPVIAQKES